MTGFRVWYKGKMYYPEDVYKGEDEDDPGAAFAITSRGQIFLFRLASIVFREVNWEMVQDAIVMFDTGYKDKNGRLIYEGDLIASDYMKKASPLYNVEVAGKISLEVEYPTAAFGTFFDVVACNIKPFALSEYLDMMEVVGNIYENPEMKCDINKGEKQMVCLLCGWKGDENDRVKTYTEQTVMGGHVEPKAGCHFYEMGFRCGWSCGPLVDGDYDVKRILCDNPMYNKRAKYYKSHTEYATDDVILDFVG